VVHPAGNADFVEACARYRALLKDASTFSSMTVEELLSARACPGRRLRPFVSGTSADHRAAHRRQAEMSRQTVSSVIPRQANRTRMSTASRRLSTGLDGSC
jgi:hypothetical protein